MSARSRAALAAVLIGFAGAGTASAASLTDGVWCEGFTCTNDNDEAYVVNGVVTCSEWVPPSVNPDGTLSSPTTALRTEGFAEVVAAHTTRTLSPACPGAGMVVSAGVTGAYPQSRPPTGSAG
ncbi:hypothetical protein ACWEVD_21135 [Nocardia thailandica]